MLNPNTISCFKKLSDKLIKFDLSSYPFCFYWDFSATGFRFYRNTSKKADLIIQATPFALLNSLKQKTPFNPAIKLKGDLELAQQLQSLMQKLEIDWEELLSRFTGDVVAHHLGRIAFRVKQQAQRSLQSFQHAAPEYLHNETNLLAHPYQIENFYTEIVKLSQDMDRLEKIVEQLSSLLISEAKGAV